MWARRKTPSAALGEDPYPAQSNGLNWWFVRVYWGDEAAAQYQTLPAYDSLSGPDVPIHPNLAWDALRGGRPAMIEVATSGLPPDDSLVALLADNPAQGVRIVSA